MMAKRLMKRSKPRGMTKRLLAMMMVLSLVMGLLPTAAFAQGWTNQVADGYFTVDASGSAVYNEGEIPDVTQDGYTVRKNIEQTGKNAFDITLEVVTSQTVKTNDAAVILVLDTSASMSSEMRNLRAATKNFIDSLVKNNEGGKIYVSVVGFGGYAYTVSDWQEITTNGTNGVKSKIDDLKAGSSYGATGGTNLEAGLMLARNRLEMDAVSSASEKYTVLFTDGEPTFRVEGETSSTEYVGVYGNASYTYDGSGTNCSEKERNEAAAMANQVKALGDLYTICYGVGEDILYGSTECVHCGQPRSQHTKVDEAEWWQWGHDYHYYCKTGGTEYEAASVTMAQYLENEIATPAADGVTYAFAAEDSEEINAAFADIASSVSEGSSGAGTQVIDPMGQFINFGGIDKIEVKGGTASFDEASKTLTWTLDPDDAQTSTSGGTTTYTFTLTYSITLDTAAQGFQETEEVNGEVVTKNYPTNGYTRLTVPGEDDIAFNVPGVFGTIPEAAYTIEYYKWDKETKQYPTTPTESTTGTAKVWSKVNPPEGYEEKYDRDHYSYKDGAPSSITVSVNPADNVIKLYYMPDTATVTVNHYYRTDVTDVEGDKAIGPYGEPDTDTFTAYVGDRYPESGEVALKTQDGLYTLVTSMDEAGYVSDSRYINSVSEDGNVINLYYVQHTDNRLKASVTLQENYETWEWKINATTGRYELKQVENKPGTPEVVVKETRIPSNHTQNIPNETGYTVESITANGENITRDGQGNITFALQEGTNPIVVTYKNVIDNRGEPVDVTINHYYTQHNYTSDGNGLTDTPNPNSKLGATVTVQRYVGETFDFAADTDSEGFKTSYEGATYEAKSTAPAAFTVTPEGATVNIYYERSVYPDKATFTVNNYFRTWTSVIDPDTGDVSWEIIEEETITDTETYPLEGSGATYYVGQTHTVPTNPEGRTDYTQDLMADEGWSNDISDKTITLTDGPNVANVYFDKKDGEAPTSASVTVVHQYYKEVETVKDGVVTTEKRFEGETSETKHGPVGAAYTITPVLTHGGNNYNRDDDVSLTTSYNNGTVTLTYVRDGGSDLTATDLTVTHNYFVKNMTVENGVAGYYNAPVSEGGSNVYVVKDKNGNVITDHSKLYVGMEVTVELAPGYNGQTYAARTDNPATTLTLGNAGNNNLVLNYDRENPLAKVKVTVDHTYLEHVYTYENGVESVETKPSTGPQTEVEKYVGESYTAAPVPNGYTLTSAKDGENDIEPAEGAYVVTVGENGNSIQFVYEKDTGKRTPVTVTVYHYYTEIDWDGTKTGCGTIGYEAETDGPINSYAGLTYTATLKLKADENGENGYTLVDQNSTPAFDNGLTITLQEGLNEIHLYYEKQIDTRQATKVKVIHNYYARDTYTVDSTLSDADYIAQENVEPEYQTETVYDTIKDGIWVGNEYTATMYNIVYFKDDQGVASIERVYDLVNATPEGGKIASIAALEEGKIPAGNIVTFNLIREYSTDPGDTTYTVVHEYYTNGSLSGSTQTSGNGKVGATVNAADIAKVTTYDGNTYSYTSASVECITLAADGSSTITLRYDRSTGGGGSTTTYYDVTVNYYDQDTGEKIAQSYTDSIRSGRSYDVTAYDAIAIEGYNYVETTGDALTGTMNGNKVINVYYTAAEANIDDGDVPMGELPDDPGTGETEDPGVDLEDPDVPMGEVPETGDSLMAWVAAAGVSGVALVWLAITGKKRKDEREG